MQKPSVIGIVGLGSVGERLLLMLHAAGFDVIGVDCELDVLARMDRRMKAETAAGDEGRCVLTDHAAVFGRAGVVVEAVPEDEAAKTEVLGWLGSVCPDETVLVSTSARIPLTRLAAASGRPDRTVGLRFFTPPSPGGAVEPVHTTMSGSPARAALAGLIAALGLTPVESGARPAADATALVYAYLNRAVAIVEQGYADRTALDTAMRLGCGLPKGPLRALDEAGLDTVQAVLSALYAATGEDRFRPAPLLTAMVRAGTVGRKSGHGFYEYDLTDEPCQGTQEAADTQLCEVRSVGVVGSGTMARGVAEVAAVAGFPTVLVARSGPKAEAAAEAVAASLTRAVRRGRISPQSRSEALERLVPSVEWPTVADCDLVVEAVAEDPDVKREVFARLGTVCRPGALLATATSSLSVADCAAASGRPADVLGLHFFNPAPAMRLVELVRTDRTGPHAARQAAAFCRRLGKTAVECGDRAGFLVNYLLFPYLADAVRLLDRPDADIAETDAAVQRGFGYPMGPFALLDTIGLDVSLAILQRLHEAYSSPDFEPPALLGRLVELGSLGRKNGRGFHHAE